MAWDRTTPTNPKYRTPEHRRERRRYEQQMKANGYLVCQQPICVNPTRIITAGTPWHLGHDDTGTHYIGPVCANCNIIDAAKRASQRSRAPQRWSI